jgi:hypothetical protein
MAAEKSIFFGFHQVNNQINAHFLPYWHSQSKPFPAVAPRDQSLFQSPQLRKNWSKISTIAKFSHTCINLYKI